MPATTYQVTNRPEISAPGRLEPVRRQVKVAMTATIASSGTNWIATIVDSGTKPGSGIGLNSFPVSHSVRYCSADQHDEAERQRQDVGQVKRAARGAERREIAVQDVQRDHEKRRDWQEIDQEDQELLRAHQFQRDDPEAEVDLEGEIAKPERGIADGDRGQRDQDRRADDPAAARAFRREAHQGQRDQPLMTTQTRIWLVMPWGRKRDGATKVPPSAKAG